tara:strand:+ start:697 stop:1353 length:657 start_codon:yes stop_codon:yes gene_type:complete
MKPSLVKKFIIGIFCSLYILVSLISTVHVIDFFEIANPRWMAITLAVAFEIGAAASLASLVILDKMNRSLVWALFITITLMQMQGNLYHAFIHMGDFTQWSQLFDLIEEDPLFQKRILAGVTAGILPLVALGFIKSLVDYIKPEDETEHLLSSKANKEHLEESIKQAEEIEEELEDLEDLDPEEVEAWKRELIEEDLLSDAWQENERRKRDEYLKKRK